MKNSQREVAGTHTVEIGDNLKTWQMANNIGIQQGDPEKEDDNGVEITTSTSTSTLNAKHTVAHANEKLESGAPPENCLTEDQVQKLWNMGFGCYIREPEIDIDKSGSIRLSSDTTLSLYIQQFVMIMCFGVVVVVGRSLKLETLALHLFHLLRHPPTCKLTDAYTHATCLCLRCPDPSPFDLYVYALPTSHDHFSSGFLLYLGMRLRSSGWRRR